MSIATAIVTGAKPSAALATEAVQQALAKLGADQANSVLLYLSSDFAANPQAAIKAAAKAASTTQVIGCSATGIFTEDDWVTDGAAAAVMVFTGEVSISNAPADIPLALSLVAPNAINTTWLDSPSVKFGGVSGDATGRGAFSVWQNAKGSTQGYCEIALHNSVGEVAASHGLKLLCNARRITQAQGFDCVEIGNLKALSILMNAWQKHQANQQTNQQANQPLATHQLMAVFSNKASDIERGDYFISPIISANEAEQSVTLAHQLQVGQWMAWAVRDVDAAQLDIVKMVAQLKKQLGQKPQFALMFSCLGRGPYFYDGMDLDLGLVKTLLPDVPLIGFYGNGEIAPILGKNTILPYSAVLGLFS